MAHRLSLMVGLVNDRDRAPDSPDAVLVVEPSIGSVARSKGQLFLLVTSTTPGARAREAARQAAEAMSSAYYYDESAGIRVCIEKVISMVNQRLAHQRDRLGMAPSDEAGPIGVAVAVVRGNELYVATVGPAEAYLVRGARLSTLPDPHRDRGLPLRTVTPEVWRGEVSVGDSLVLVSPNLARATGPEALKDSLITLHPQAAMEQLHQRYMESGGSGSDAAVAVEITEVSATARQRTLVPVRPPEPLAGTPDRSPIPLADSVEGGVAAVQEGARQARVAAGGVFTRGLDSVLDRLPMRRQRQRRVTGYATRAEARRRAAIALMAFVVVAGGLGFAVWVAGGSTPKGAISSITAGQRALEAARADVDEVWAPGVDLVTGDPPKAEDLLTDAFQRLAAAEEAGIPSSTVDPVRARVVGGLDRLYGVVVVRPTVAFSFTAPEASASPAASPAPTKAPAKTPQPSSSGPPASPAPTFDLGAVIRGPDGQPYVIDRSSQTVYRIDTKGGGAVPILKAGQKVGSTKAGMPLFLAVGGPDLLILDSANDLWRWTPADRKGRGTLARIKVSEAPTWGDDIRGIGTFCRSTDCALYNLYVIDPSERQIRTYTPAADGSGYPGHSTGRLATARDVSGFSSLYIDGDIWVTDDGTIERYVAGKDDGWRSKDPGDELLRSAPSADLIASGDPRRTGRMYAYDRANQRVIAYQKIDGAYVEQYRLEGTDDGWADVRGMYVVAGVEDGPDTLVWVDRDRLMSAVLESPVSTSATPSGSPTATPSGSPAASPASSGASPSPSPAPSK